MKYGSFLPLFTSSQADITLFVNGRGPHENTPILETYGGGRGGIRNKSSFKNTFEHDLHRNASFVRISEN